MWCQAFPALPDAQCRLLEACAAACGGERPCPCDGGLLPNYRCRWSNATSDTITAILAPE